MNTASPSPHDGVFQRLASRLGEWRKWRAERDELNALGCETANRLLAECGLTVDDLDRMTNPKARELLPEMMAALGVPDDARSLASRHDLERTCGACGEWRRCESALAVGTAIDTWREFCGNADTLDALAPKQGATSSTKG